MSNVRVNTILDAAGGNTATINGMTPTAQSLQGFRNRIINGDMRIDQRNAGASITVSSGSTSYPVDRMLCYVETGSSGTFTAQRSTVAPAGFTNSLLLTTATADSSITTSEGYSLQHRVEGFNVADLGWGAAGAQSVTLSFWVRSSLTGTFAGSITNGSFNRAYVFNFTISAANTYEYKTVTISGDTGGSWNTSNGTGLIVYFSLGAGAGLQQTAGAWGGFGYATSGAVSPISTAGATFNITGVQLEAGSVATPFERRDYGRELMMCQRYAVVYNSNDSNQSNRIAFGVGTTGARAFCMVKHPVTMRAKPSLSSAGVFILSDTNNANNITSSIIQSVTSDVHQTNIEANVASGLTQYRPYFYEFGSAGGTLTLSSEL